MKAELTTYQTYLYRQLIYWFSKQNVYKVTHNSMEKEIKGERWFLRANSGKRFLWFNFDMPDGKTYFSITEDGNTRTAFHGFVNTLDDFKKIMDLAW